MCCDDMGHGPAVGECRECGEPINEDGEAVNMCGYSDIECSTCHSRPCDGSC